MVICPARPRSLLTDEVQTGGKNAASRDHSLFVASDLETMLLRVLEALRRASLVSFLLQSTPARRQSTIRMAGNPPHLWVDASERVLETCILPLDASNHKGSSGRIAVLGGSEKYTGAPYYAAMAALYTGVDLATVYCAQEAALPIKSYSPELMVAPVYEARLFQSLSDKPDSHEARAAVQSMVNAVSLDRLHCLIVGPGLGRCTLVFRALDAIVSRAQLKGVMLVFDADALHYLKDFQPTLGARVVLTPNAVERKILPDDLGDATVVVKGAIDSVQRCNRLLFECRETGGLKRSGGIGDVLAGATGALAAWQVILDERGLQSDLGLSSWAACCFVKQATRRAFQEKGRAMTAPDVLRHLGPSIRHMLRDDCV